MTECEDILIEISDDELPKLRDMYKSFWPHAMNVYYYIDNYINWKKRKVSNIKFYCPEGRWDDGTIIAIEYVSISKKYLLFLQQFYHIELSFAIIKAIKMDFLNKIGTVYTIKLQQPITVNISYLRACRNFDTEREKL